MENELLIQGTCFWIIMENEPQIHGIYFWPIMAKDLQAQEICSLPRMGKFTQYRTDKKLISDYLMLFYSVLLPKLESLNIVFYHSKRAPNPRDLFAAAYT